MALEIGLSRYTSSKKSKDQTFFDAIERPDLNNLFTPQTPWVSLTMEIYLEQFGFPGNGGLGVLEGDKALVAAKLGLPFMIFTNFYSQKIRQVIDKNFFQGEVYETITPEEQGCHKVAETDIKANNGLVKLDLYEAKGVPVYGFYEPGMQEVYAKSNNSEHRFYQQNALGFATPLVFPKLGINPAYVDAEEAAVCCGPLALMDQFCLAGNSIDEALRLTKGKVLYTNHTLVPAAIASFSREMFEKYTIPNIQSQTLKKWLLDAVGCQGDSCNLSVLSTSLAGKYNCVSKLHAKIASGNFRKIDGTSINFEGITNGICLDRWIYPDLLTLYKKAGIMDEYDLPSPYYRERIKSLDRVKLRQIKNSAREDLRLHLKTWHDQYDQPIGNIPLGDVIILWAKRLAGYKRPGMILEDIGWLKKILIEKKAHLVFAGKAHPSDVDMKLELQRMLKIIDQDEVLRQRVHFIVNYNEKVAGPLIAGVDINMNTPEKGSEADGTFWKKGIGCLTRLISRDDGGVADITEAHYLKIDGEDYHQEVQSLYCCLEQACDEVRDPQKWAATTLDQLEAYWPIMCMGRMYRDYFNFACPKTT